MKIGNTAITFEENDDRMKVVIPLKQNFLITLLYSALALFWFSGLIAFVVLLFQPQRLQLVADFRFTTQLCWGILVLAWIYVWVRYIGRNVLRWWQFYLAKRELLFIDEKTVIIRRPVSIMGLTDSYDRQYIRPIYHSEQHKALAFPYGNVKQILFAMTVPQADQLQLMSFLNNRYFPHYDDDDDDDDDD